MRFARWVFLCAGIYGLAVIVPLYFQEGRYGQDHPPALNHPEFYYGFLGVTLAWQIMFLLIGTDPVRFRPAMLLPALVEKASFAIAIPLLYVKGRAPGMMVAAAGLDAVWAVLFVVAYLRTPKAVPGPPTSNQGRS